MEPFNSVMHTLMKSNKDFVQKLKQQLVLESNKVTNPFQFIAGLIAEGLLTDGSSDTEAVFGLKEIMVQLAITIACTKGDDAIGGLVKALEGSGNSQLISALHTWAKKDFPIETDGVVSDPATTDQAKDLRSSTQMNSGGTKLIDKVISRMEYDFMKQLEGHWVGLASKILNFPEFRSSLFSQNVLVEPDMQVETGPAGKDEQWTTKAIRAACSNRAIRSLVLALQHSGNEHIIQQMLEWLEAAPVKRNNYPIAVKSLAKQQLKQAPKAGKSTFFEQPPPTDGLQKVATFNGQPEFSTKGPFVLEFDKEELRMRFPDCAMKVWSLQTDEEKIIKFGVQVKNITCSQFDEEILVVGTAEGTVHLFDPKTREEKFSIRFSDPVKSLKFVESTLVVLTESDNRINFSWVDISRSDMRLLNRRLVHYSYSQDTLGFYIDPDYSFLHTSNRIEVRSTKTGSCVFDWRHHLCWLQPPANISTLNVLGFISTDRNIVAGCENGLIATWNKFAAPGQKPRKILRRHTEEIVGLCAVKGHLVSLDQGGKLLMWSGYDLENEDSKPLVARNLADNLFHVTSLVAHERWFASCSPKEGIINVWTLPDLWLRTG